jgi:hypothetical protein
VDAVVSKKKNIMFDLPLKVPSGHAHGLPRRDIGPRSLNSSGDAKTISRGKVTDFRRESCKISEIIIFD